MVSVICYGPTDSIMEPDNARGMLDCAWTIQLCMYNIYVCMCVCCVLRGVVWLFLVKGACVSRN